MSFAKSKGSTIFLLNVSFCGLNQLVLCLCLGKNTLASPKLFACHSDPLYFFTWQIPPLLLEPSRSVQQKFWILTLSSTMEASYSIWVSAFFWFLCVSVPTGVFLVILSFVSNCCLFLSQVDAYHLLTCFFCNHVLG